MPKFWIGVASKEHVKHGVQWGICQFCHGKIGPAKRLKKGDFVIYYSPKVSMEGKEPYQKFTAIGKITDETPYQFDMGNGFMPYRRDIDYFKEATSIDIKPLIPILPFIKNKSAWGYTFRYGFFEIDPKSFRIIAAAMLEKTTPNCINYEQMLQYKNQQLERIK